MLKRLVPYSAAALCPNTPLLRAVFALALAVALATTDAHAQKNGENASGRIELATSSGSYPLIIDGQPQGETSPTVRLIDLTPGRHTVEIQFPNGVRWVRDFQILPNKRQCITLAFRPRTITIERAAKSPCPYPVNVSAPASVKEGDIVTFSADVNYGGTAGLNYAWTVSPPPARIVGGAGTPTITVDSTGLGRQRLTAVLVVDDGSGDARCRQSAQAATDVVPAPAPPAQERPRRFDEFPSVAFDDDKARLDNFAVELQNDPSAAGYIFVYGGRTARAGSADRLLRRTRDYLVNTRRIDASRLHVVNGGYRETNAFELWIVPKGATPPSPSPTVSPGDVRPRRR